MSTPQPAPSNSASSEHAYWFIFSLNRILTDSRRGTPEVPRFHSIEQAFPDPVRVIFLGTLGDTDCYGVDSGPDAAPPDGMQFSDLRPLLGQLPDALFSMAGRALQLLDWQKSFTFCPRCSAELQDRPEERAKGCPSCNLVSYPPVVPAIIVAVVRDGKLLLAHSHRFKFAFYSVLAGFVEPGETLEECVRREVREEVGIEISDIRYFGSLPWPFPNVLMTGFTARHKSGEIVVDPKELRDAGWYGPDELPAIPGKGSIARQLIDWFLATHQKV